VAIDRDDALRRAEKLLRQGQLDSAIAEYERIVDLFPTDFNTANTLGDLYHRAGQADRAVTQFLRIADHWLAEGFFSKAAAHYKKVLKLAPEREIALLQLIEACIRQGLMADAKMHLRSALDQRTARGDEAGAEELTLRLADLDPTDFEARLAAARIRARSAADPAMTSELRALVASLDEQGRSGEVEVLLKAITRLDPEDTVARVRIARILLNRGDMENAAGALPDVATTNDWAALLLATEIAFRSGEVADGRTIVDRLFDVDRAKARIDVGTLIDKRLVFNLEATYVCCERLVDDFAATREFGPAAERLKKFLRESPNSIPALLRLVEVCVDGDLDEELTAAQGHLADAYLEKGEAQKARFIAEDLLARFPQASTEQDRLRRALEACGEADPDAIIAARLGFAADASFEDEDDFTPPMPMAASAPQSPVSSSQSPASFSSSGPLDAASADPGFQSVVPGLDAVMFDGMDFDPPSSAAPPPSPPELQGTTVLAPPTPVAPSPVMALPVEPPVAAMNGVTLDEIDLTGALDALAKPGVSVSEALSASRVTSPSPLPTASSDPVDAPGGFEAVAPEAAQDESAAEFQPDLTSMSAAASPAPAVVGEPEPDLDLDLDPVLDDEPQPDLGALMESDAPIDTIAPADAAEAEDVPEAEDIAAPEPAQAAPDPSLEQVFANLRADATDEAAELPPIEQATRQMKIAETYLAAGMVEEAEFAFQQAANDPRFRFRAAAGLGRLMWRQGKVDAAVEWLVRASEASAPSPDESWDVLYELADALEASGETTRALALLLEVQAEQPEFRDVASRIDRLMRAKAEP